MLEYFHKLGKRCSLYERNLFGTSSGRQAFAGLSFDGCKTTPSLETSRSSGQFSSVVLRWCLFRSKPALLVKKELFAEISPPCEIPSKICLLLHEEKGQPYQARSCLRRLGNIHMNTLRRAAHVNSISISGMLTSSQLAAQKVKPRHSVSQHIRSWR